MIRLKLNAAGGSRLRFIKKKYAQFSGITYYYSVYKNISHLYS